MPRLSCVVRPSPEQWPLVDGLPRVVPGVQINRYSTTAALSIPEHGAHWLGEALTGFDIPFAWTSPLAGPWPDFMSKGCAVARYLADEGLLRPGQQNLPTSYQFFGLGRMVSQGSLGQIWPCGSGKTFAAIMWGLYYDRPVAVATRVGALRTWEREIRDRTTVEPHVWLPPSRRRKKDESLATYLERMKARGQQPFVILGHENLAQAIYEEKVLRLFRPSSVIFDEVHRLKSHRRWEPPIVDDYGKKRWEKKDNMFSAAMDLSLQATRRDIATATLISDRPRDVWAPSDLVAPGDFGRFYDFAVRYCAAFQGPFGWDTSGSSNLGELRERLGYIMDFVGVEEVRRALPPLRRQCVWLQKGDLVQPAGGWLREMKAAARVGKETLMEVRLAMNASRKRSWVVDFVIEAVRNGQKVLVFTGRRRDVDITGEALLKVLEADTPVWTTHGADDEDVRDEICQSYMAWPGGCVLVATGDSIGESLNLQDTDILLLPMLPWTPRQVLQYEGRVARLGQKRPALVVYLIAEGTIDEGVAYALLTKLPAVVDVTGDAAARDITTVLEGRDGDADLLAAVADSMSEIESDWTIEED